MLKVKRQMSRRGSVLIESIVGISIAIIGMTGIFALLSRSLAINRDITQKLVATYLSSEGIEIVKSLIDTNVVRGGPWNKGVSSGNYEDVPYNATTLPAPIVGQATKKISFENASGIYSYNSGSPTPFKRTIKISELSADEIKVVSDVEWDERNIIQKISLEDHFFNWR